MIGNVAQSGKIKIGTKLKNIHTGDIQTVTQIEIVRINPKETTVVFTINGFRSNEFYTNKNWEVVQ